MLSRRHDTGMLVTFSGVDCAGKTTQINRLDDALGARGLTTAQLWFRPGYSVEMQRLKNAVRQWLPGSLPSPGPSQAREQAFSRPSVTGSWLAMALADTLLQYTLKLRWMLRRYDVLICDRYLQDARLDLLLRFGDHRQVLEPMLAAIEYLAPEPDLAVLLLLPHEIMLERMRTKDEPFPDPAELRDERFAAYQRMSDKPGLVVVDAQDDIEDVSRGIFDHFQRRWNV